MAEKDIQIRYIQPFSLSLNIGQEYNKVVSEQIDDCWIVLRDQDTLPCRPDWGNQIHALIEDNPRYHIFTCMTNRVAIREHCVPGMFDEADISKHIETALSMNGTDVEPTLIAPGLCMIFHKSVWNKVKFKTKTPAFDIIFSYAARKKGFRIGLAKGVYLLHLYRWGQENPMNYKSHLTLKNQL